MNSWFTRKQAYFPKVFCLTMGLIVHYYLLFYITKATLLLSVDQLFKSGCDLC